MDADSPVVIGLTTELLDAPWYEGRRRYQLFTDYSDCLRRAGAVPMLIPGDTPVADIPTILDRVDGVLTTGGDDADLRAFGGPAPTAECKPVPSVQQELNLALSSTVLDRDMPLLAVCFGMQMLGLSFQAELEQHMPLHQDHVKGVQHSVQVSSGSKLHEVVAADQFPVPSFHHQALLSAGRGLSVSAQAADGTIEAIEARDASFCLGVQWHPERAPDSAASRALFSRFVAAAAAYRKTCLTA